MVEIKAEQSTKAPNIVVILNEEKNLFNQGIVEGTEE